MKNTDIAATFVFFMAGTLLASGAEIPSEQVSRAPVAVAVNEAHAALWEKFIGEDGLIHDYVGEIPTPEDCKLGRPNAIGWWSPIENGPMFTGLYLPAVCERARRSGNPVDRDKARRLVRGLLKCASVSDVPGFIVRGTGTDGKCHYPLGSEDQTFPWFYGLHAYVTGNIPTPDERKQVVAKMKEVADVLEKSDWKCPCGGAFKGQFRGQYEEKMYLQVPCYLFLLRAMYDVTHDNIWLERYQKALAECPNGSDNTRLELCALGYGLDREVIRGLDHGYLWIYVKCQGALAQLAVLETDKAIRARYREGLAQNAKNALEVIEKYKKFDNNDTKVFGHANWREGYSTWFPQKTQHDAERLASTGNREKLGPRKGYERALMTNPLAAAAIIALAGGDMGRETVEHAICHYDYSKLNLSEFFFAECAYFALPVE